MRCGGMRSSASKIVQYWPWAVAQAGVAGGGGAEVGLLDEVDVVGGGDFGGAVLGAVVDDDHFDRFVGLGVDALQGFGR